MADDGSVRRHRHLWHRGPHRHPQCRDRDAPSTACDDAGPGPPGPRPACGPNREDGLAGVVVKGHFPRRRIVQIVVANVTRYLFRGASQNWFLNIGSTAPARSSVTLLSLLSGLVGIDVVATHNLVHDYAA